MNNVFKKLVGGYLIGFSYASDTVANAVKKAIKVIHPLTPIVMAHRTVERLEKTRDFVGQNIHKYAYCTRCRGKGFLVVMSVGGDYVGKEPCPQCHGTGKDFDNMLGKTDKRDSLPTLSKEEAAIKIFDRMISKARSEKTIQNIYCKQCKGQRFVHVRADDGKYLGQKPCPLCEGTGKDYNSMVNELILECLEDHIKKGFSSEESWNYCMAAYPIKIQQANEKTTASPTQEKVQQELKTENNPEIELKKSVN